MAAPAQCADDGRVLLRVVAVFVVVLAVAAPCSAASQRTVFSERVTRICAGALLFHGEPRIGTRAGALRVRRATGATGPRPFRWVDPVPKPPIRAELAGRWIAVERRLVGTYASTYLRTWYVIERGRGARGLAQLLDEPKAL